MKNSLMIKLKQALFALCVLEVNGNFKWSAVGFAPLGACWVKSEIGLHSQRARRS